jgi:hypothetical protein
VGGTGYRGARGGIGLGEGGIGIVEGRFSLYGGGRGEGICPEPDPVNNNQRSNK